MKHQNSLSTKRSIKEVKSNGRKKTKLKKSYCFDGEWFLECGSKYNDHGEVEEPEISYKMMYEELKKKIIVVSFGVIRTQI